MGRFILTAVTDSSLIEKGTLKDRLEMLASAGVRRIVLREKGCDPDAYRRMATDLVSVCRRHGCTPVISHRIDVAEELGVEELQLSMDGFRQHPETAERFDVCVSVHSVQEATEAERLGASSLTAGHVYATECKKGVPQRGPEWFRDVAASVSIPVYAIGGIDLDRIEEMHGAGASGICLMSTMMRCSAEHLAHIVEKTCDINRPVFSPGCLRLYAVTDRHWLRPGETLVQKICDAVQGGATMVQLREKHLSHGELVEEAVSVLRACRAYGVPLLINDDVRAALESGADGVHLGQDDMPPSEARRILGEDAIIGVSAHSVEEAEKASSDGADYLGSGAVFVTSTKDDASALPLEELKRITASVPIPVAAIGGITRENMHALKGTGIAGAAVVSALFGQDDARSASESMLREMMDIIG